MRSGCKARRFRSDQEQRMDEKNSKSNRRQTSKSNKNRWAALIVILVSLTLLLHQATATLATSATGEAPESQTNDAATSVPAGGQQDAQAGPSSKLPANHRMEEALDSPYGEAAAKTSERSSSPRPDGSRRGSRQYDGPLSTSSTGNYAALASDSGAYVGNAGGSSLGGAASSGYGATAASNAGITGYAASMMDPGMYSQAGPMGGGYHDQMSIAGRAGYPAMHPAGGYGPPPMPPMGGGGGPLASMFPGMGGGLFSSGAFPLMAKGFDVSEIICTAIAVAIGAVIVGAPFVLLYLFIMNQMQGNGGPNAMGPNGGSISLTGPTSSTNVSGRKKRHTSFPEALFKQLSPLMNNEQVAQTFKVLMNSIAKYQA